MSILKNITKDPITVRVSNLLSVTIKPGQSRPVSLNGRVQMPEGLIVDTGIVSAIESVTKPAVKVATKTKPAVEVKTEKVEVKTEKVEVKTEIKEEDTTVVEEVKDADAEEVSVKRTRKSKNKKA